MLTFPPWVQGHVKDRMKGKRREMKVNRKLEDQGKLHIVFKRYVLIKSIDIKYGIQMWMCLETCESSVT